MAFANVRVLEINEALALNAAGFTVRIAGFYPIPAGEQVPAESSVLLSSIMNRDEVLDPLLDLRESLGADLVHVFVDNLQRSGTELCGVAYLGRYPPQADLHYLSVSHWWCAAYSTTTLHEIGHNLGAGHNREVGQGPGAFEMAYGYRTLVPGLPYPNVGVADVMSYRMNGYQRLPVFSDPFLTYGGVPMGIAYPTPGYADNSTTVSFIGPGVAAFRDDPPTPTHTPSATSTPTSTATPRQPGIDPQIPPTDTPTPTVVPTATPTQPPAPTATSLPTAVPSPTISPVSTIHGGSIVMNIGLGLGVQLKSKKTNWDVEVKVEARDKGTGQLKTRLSSACTLQLFTATSKGAIYKQPVARAFEPFRETGTMSFSIQRLPGIKPEKGKVPDVYLGAKLVCPGAQDIRATTARIRGKQVSKTLALSAWMKRFRRDLAEKR